MPAKPSCPRCRLAADLYGRRDGCRTHRELTPAGYARFARAAARRVQRRFGR